MSDPITASYVSSSSFSVSGDQTAEYLFGRKIKLYQDFDNGAVVYVVSSAYDTNTIVEVLPAYVDATLTGIKRGPSVPINLCIHNHSSNDEGGELDLEGGGGVAGSQTWIMHFMGLS